MPDKTVARARKTTTAGRKHQTSIYAGYEPKPPPLCKDVKEIKELIQAFVKKLYPAPPPSPLATSAPAETWTWVRVKFPVEATNEPSRPGRSWVCAGIPWCELRRSRPCRLRADTSRALRAAEASRHWQAGRASTLAMVRGFSRPSRTRGLESVRSEGARPSRGVEGEGEREGAVVSAC